MKLSIIKVTILLAITIISCNFSEKRQVKTKNPFIRSFGGKVKKVIEYSCSQYLANKKPLEIAKNSCKISSISEYSEDGTNVSEKSWSFNQYPDEPNFTLDVQLNEQGLVIQKETVSRGCVGLQILFI